MTPPTSVQTVTAELLPCPFCGNALGRKTGRVNPMARCTTDGCVVAAKMSVINLDDPVDVERWNTRADNKRIEAQAEIATLTSSLTAAEARLAKLEKALRAAIKTGNLLLQNSIGCATNHYGHDCELHGLPGWLTDSEKQLTESAAALSQTEEGPR